MLRAGMAQRHTASVGVPAPLLPSSVAHDYVCINLHLLNRDLI